MGSPFMDGPVSHDPVPEVWRRKLGDDAGERLPLLLGVPRLPVDPPTQAGGVLRVLLLRVCPLPY